MNEFEERLHDMLQDRGSTPVSTPQAPKQVLRRTRRRQLSTALVSGVTAAAVIGGAIVGVQAVGRGGSTGPVGAEHGPGSTRTVSLDGYGITYPYDWALQRVTVAIPPVVDPGGPMIPAPDPSDAPETTGPSGVTGVSGTSGTTGGAAITGPTGVSGVSGPSGSSGGDGTAGGDTGAGPKEALLATGQYLQLSNLYPDHLLTVACSKNADVPGTGVAFSVKAVPGSGDASDGLQPSTPDCASDISFYSGTVVANGITFEARAEIGRDASQADRDALFAAYDSISYPGKAGLFMGGGSNGSVGVEPAVGGEVPPIGTPPHAMTSVSTVVAGGTTQGGTDWVMLTDPAGTSFEVQVGDNGMGWASASAGGTDGSAPAQPDLDSSVMYFELGPPGVLGSVAGSASSVEVRPHDGDAIDVPLLPAPAVTGIDRSYFLSELPMGVATTGQVVALDANGSVIASQGYDLGSGGVVEPGCPPHAPEATSAPVPCPTEPIACPLQSGGANDDPTCPPLPTACPPLAGGDKSSVKECIVCSDAVTGPEGTTSNDSTTAACPTPLPVYMCPSPPTGAGTTTGMCDSGGGFVCPDNADCATPLPPPTCDPGPGDVVCFTPPQPPPSPGRTTG